jgi:hypothetical protein
MKRRICWVLLLVLAAGAPVRSATVQNDRLKLEAELREGQIALTLRDVAANRTWADADYLYWLRLSNGTTLRGLSRVGVRVQQSSLEITGYLGDSTVRVVQKLTLSGKARPEGARRPPFATPLAGGRENWLEEQITVENKGRQALAISDAAFGFQKRLGLDTGALRWVAVPYRRQVDGKLHDYSAEDLAAGRFRNSDWRNDNSVADQELSDAGKLRSEAWAWSDGKHGLLVAKYNQEMIEYSVASVEKAGAESKLRFGGAGLALCREPRPATFIAPGGRVTFGVSRYIPFDGGWPVGYEAYHAFLNEKGHYLPADYSPPLNWNELFDAGWYHSNREQLFKNYTREALFKEAAKAKDIGCDLLYLDPGWEICEGTTLWDQERLGKVADFAHELKERFGLGLGYRTIGRVYRDEFPKAWYLRRQAQEGDYQMPRVAAPLPPEPAPLLAPDGRRNVALLPAAKANASSLIPGYPELHTIGHLNDGYYNNTASWVSAGEPSWVEIDLGVARTVNEIALGSEHRVHFNDRAITRFEVRVATQYAAESEAPGWQQVFRYDGKPIHATEHFRFEPVAARWVRVLIQAAAGSPARIDELEIYEAAPGADGPLPARRAPPKGSEGSPIGFWEVCTQSKAWQQEKLKRILAVTGGGVDFMMFDEFDWRGPCYDPHHGHPVPSTPEGHVRAIYGLIEGMRTRYPRVLVEAHDPVWPWTMRYTPTYFRQGFTHHRYQENWGFEFMWNPIDDLRSGRALCLYYYNLGCEIPLYDHITMEGDNDACLSFWWYASTVRHLGIGGKKGLNSKQDNEVRYAAYKRAVAEYNRRRDFYARGRFIGLDETAHLHVHPAKPAAVLNVFNLTDAPTRREVRFEPALVGLGQAENLAVESGLWRKEGPALVLVFDLPPLSPAQALIGAK